ncbi:MAG: Lrp/AsnC family transcriptional regulator [Bdellovibrionota bacterium]
MHFKKEISIRAEIRTFPRKFLSRQAAGGAELLQGGEKTTELDDIDARVLKAAGTPGFESFRRLAERAGISSSTFDRRVKQLEAKKVIEGFYYILEPALFQMQEYRLLLSAPSAKPKLGERLLHEARCHPNVRKWIRCVGSWDYELEVNVRSSRDASALVSELRRKFHGEVGCRQLAVPVRRDERARLSSHP